MKKHPKVTVIVLNWNGRKFLEQNLDSVLNQDYDNYDVLLVDNGSLDSSLEFVKARMSKGEKLKILSIEENLGYVRGNNIGIKKVLEEGKSEYVALLNNDVKVEKSWLRNLISGFSDKNVGICASLMYLYYPYQQIVLIPSEDMIIDSVRINYLNYHLLEYKEGFDRKGELLLFPKKVRKGEKYNFAVPFVQGNSEGRLEIKFKEGGLKVFSGVQRFKLSKNDNKKIRLDGKRVINNAGTKFIKEKIVFEDRYIYEFDRSFEDEIVDAACGGAMGVRCDLLRKLGLYNEKYYMYLEDTELSYRFRKAGYKVKFISKAICYHWFWGSSAGKMTNLQTYHGTRNRLWFIRRYFGIFRYLYYFTRNFLRALIWGVKIPFHDQALMFFTSYIKSLLGSMKSDR
jgi:GT2 family glycosyltransferase